MMQGKSKGSSLSACRGDNLSDTGRIVSHQSEQVVKKIGQTDQQILQIS